MTASTRPAVVDERSFRRMAALAAIVSLPAAAGNVLTMFLAVHFDVGAMSNPVILIRQGPGGASLWHWSMVLDTLGYYLLIVPVVVLVRASLRSRSPSLVDLSALGLLAYCLIGAIGGAILATALPPLISGYASAGQHRAILETVFNGYSNAVYRGMWNLLEELLAGLGWIGLGLVLRSEQRRLGQVTTLLGVACLVDSFGTAVNLDAIASVGLTVYLVLAPVWACWIGVRLWRAQIPFSREAGRMEASEGDVHSRTVEGDVMVAGGGRT